MPMDNTCIDYFNYYLKEFLNDLVAIYPLYKDNILHNYRDLLEGKDNKSDKYIKYFITKANNNLEQIAKKDNELLINDEIMLLEGVRLSDIWKKDELTDKNKNTIWRYLQLLTLLSRRSIITQTELKMMLSKVGTSINVLEKVDDTLEEKEEGKKESGGMFGGLADAFAGDNDGEVNLLGELMKGFGLGKIFENFNMNEFMEQMETGFNSKSI